MNKRGAILFSSVGQFEFSLNRWPRKLGLSTCGLVAWHSFLLTEVERDNVAPHKFAVHSGATFRLEYVDDYESFSSSEPRILCAKKKSSGVEIGLRVRVLTSEHAQYENFRPPNIKCTVTGRFVPMVLSYPDDSYPGLDVSYPHSADFVPNPLDDSYPTNYETKCSKQR